MRTASAPEALAPAPFQGADPQRIVALWSGLALCLCVPLVLLPAAILPNGVPLSLVFAGAAATLIARMPAGSFRYDMVTPITLAYGAIGLLYVAASLLQVLPVGSQRPVRPDFILRHSYFVFLWIPLMAGTAAMFRATLPDLAALARRAASPVLALLAIGDIVSAAALGAPERIVWESYTSFFDPPALTFLTALSFFLAVAVSGRIAIPLAIATVHCAVSNFTNYGMMFNSITGMFVFGCMWAFAIVLRWWGPRAALLAVIALGTALVFGMIVGSLLPDVIGFDINTQWRFLVWRENLFAALESGLLGVGFGTPYYELSAGNIAEAYRLSHFAEFTQYQLSSPIDILYIRGQHSSFVNAFYRMGLLGGALLVAFNVAVLVLLIKAAWRGAREYGHLVAAGGAIFVVESSQIAMHVGIESPRYFAAYALAIGLARAASNLASRGARG
jgi:hypothetical protein